MMFSGVENGDMASLLDNEDLARLSRPQSRLATDYRPADVGRAAGGGIGDRLADERQEDTWGASEHAASALLSQLDAKWRHSLKAIFPKLSHANHATIQPPKRSASKPMHNFPNPCIKKGASSAQALLTFRWV